jgi:shikimate kinase
MNDEQEGPAMADSDSSFIAHPSSFPILLMGLRGSGKSTLGRRLAEELGVGFIDLDDRTRARLACRTVAEAFETRGERTFRQAEVAALRDALGEAMGARGRVALPHTDALQGPDDPIPLAAEPPAHPPVGIIALGGGTPTAPGAAEILRQAFAAGARIIYLHASAPTLRARLKDGDPNRPALTGAGLLAEIDDILEARDSLYRSLATAVLETDGLDVDAALAALEQAILE